MFESEVLWDKEIEREREREREREGEREGEEGRVGWGEVGGWSHSTLAPRIFFIFPPFLREEGRGVRGDSGERGISLKSEEKGGEKGGGRRVDPRKGSGASLGGGVLNIYFQG